MQLQNLGRPVGHESFPTPISYSLYLFLIVGILMKPWELGHP